MSLPSGKVIIAECRVGFATVGEGGSETVVAVAGYR